jgi:iron complex transport system substrate-binding protein
MRGRRRYLVGLLILAVALGAAVLLLRPRVLPPAGPGAEPAAAGSPSSPGWPRTFTDTLRHTATLAHPARRIVTLSPSLAEIVCALGAGQQLVGVDDFTKYPPEAAAKPKLGGIINPSLESILAVQPDLVLAARGVDATVLKRLQDVGGLATLSYDPQSLDQILDTITQIGQVCGRESAAEQLVAKLRARRQAVTTRVAARGGPRPRLLVVISWDGLFVAGEHSFVDDLITTAGGENAARLMHGLQKNQSFPTVTREMVVVADPQLLVFAGVHSLPAGGSEQGILDWLRRDAAWRDLSAVKSGSVVIVDQDLVTLPSPRLWDGLEAVAAAIAKVPAGKTTP